MRKISAKRLKKLGGKPVWSSISKRSSVRKTNPKRKKAEFARCYGSKARVLFVKSLPCAIATGFCVGAIENAHTENGGMGRKAGHSEIIPLCHFHHTLFDEHRSQFDYLYPDFDPEKAAAETESRWLAFSDSPRTGVQE